METKGLIGLHVGLYRTFYQHSYKTLHYPGRWSQRGFIYELNCIRKSLDCFGCTSSLNCTYQEISYISRATLKKLEKGEIVRDYVLEMVINRLEFKYKYFDINVEHVIEELYNTIVESDFNKIELLKEKLKIDFSLAKQYFFYNDIYDLCIAAIDYHLFRKPFEYKHLSFLFYQLKYYDNFNMDKSKYFEIIFHYCVLMYSNFYPNIRNIDHLGKYADSFENTPLIYYTKGALNYCLSNHSIVLALENINIAYDLFDKQNNSFRCFECLMMKTTVTMAIDTRSAEVLFRELECIIDNNSAIPTYKKNMLYYNRMSYYYFNKKDYLKALNYSLLQNESEKIKYYTNLVISFHLKLMGNQFLNKNDIKIIDDCEVIIFKIILEYFKYKKDLYYENDSKEKKKIAKYCNTYIFTSIVPILSEQITNRFLMSVFYNELLSISQYYKNSDDILKYDRILKINN